MPIPVTIPRLGWNMDEGTFVEWLKADGEPVRAGDVIFGLEGEKATEEVESLDAGTLHIPASGPKPGDKIAVGAVIGYLLQAGESSPDVGPVESPASRERERLEIVPPIAHGPGSPRATPAITPRARRLANERGIDWSRVRGSGSSGRIRERDIAAHATEPVIPITPIRRAIAARMMESRHSTAPVTLTSIVDATRLVELRARFKTEGGGPTPSFTDCFMKLAAIALQKHPLFASRWTDAGIVTTKRFDIGMAVETDAGLLVPVVRDVLALTLREIATRSHDLIDRGRKGTLSASDMQGGCFTVTNLGSFGINAFTPIINPPECAVLGIGRITRQPVMDGDRVVGRELVTLSLTFDHRIVDGGPAARFLQTLAKNVENPGEYLP